MLVSDGAMAMQARNPLGCRVGRTKVSGQIRMAFEASLFGNCAIARRDLDVLGISTQCKCPGVKESIQGLIGIFRQEA